MLEAMTGQVIKLIVRNCTLEERYRLLDDIRIILVSTTCISLVLLLLMAIGGKYLLKGRQRASFGITNLILLFVTAAAAKSVNTLQHDTMYVLYKMHMDDRVKKSQTETEILEELLALFMMWLNQNGYSDLVDTAVAGFNASSLFHDIPQTGTLVRIFDKVQRLSGQP